MSGILIGAKPGIIKPKTARAYGIIKNQNSTTTQYTRTLSSIGLNEPIPAVGTGAGSSPFDFIMPWAGMREFNVIDGVLSYEKDVDPEFSRSAYDTVVSIPKFWYKANVNSGNFELAIANGELSGYDLFPLFIRPDGSIRDVAYVGRYEAGAGYVSKCGMAPLCNITRATFRNGARSKGTYWAPYDIQAHVALWFLYLVEYADTNSQSRIGEGNSNTSGLINTGGTDSMTYHTGRGVGSDVDGTAVQYRGIENPWANIWKWVDGINFNGLRAYICLDPAKYKDDSTTDYTDTGLTIPSNSSGSYIVSWNCSAIAEWLFLPGALGGSSATYVPDMLWSSTGWKVLRCGGNYGTGSSGGLFALNANYDSSNASASLGGRLLYLP